MNDRAVDSFVEEVNEEFRRDQALHLWKRYGRYFSAVILAVVLGTVGYTYWRGEQIKAAEKASLEFQQAVDLIDQNKLDEAIALFNQLSKSPHQGYAALAGLREAQLLRQQGKIKEAAGLYQLVADNSETPKILAEVALLQAVSLNFSELSAADIKSKLEKLSDQTNPWRHSAQELEGLALIKAGDKAAALTIFQSLKDDTSAPAGLRQRATEYLGAIGE